MAGRGRRKPISELIDWEAVTNQDKDCNPFRGFKLKEKLKDGFYDEVREAMLETMTGREVTIDYFQQSGFTKPILVQRRDDLGLKV